MNWKNFWENSGKQPNAMWQVGRVIDGKAFPETLIKAIANDICQKLNINKNSSVLDVCCGNGIITHKIATACNNITGLDFSENLIAIANQHKSNNETFIIADAKEFWLNKQFDAVYIYFSFQYFESNTAAKNVLKCCLRHLKPGGKLLIADTPDLTRWFNFYRTPLQFIFWLKQSLLGQNTMGKFWHPKKLLNLCTALGADATIIHQQPWQPYNHYRFDLIATKKPD